MRQGRLALACCISAALLVTTVGPQTLVSGEDRSPDFAGATAVAEVDSPQSPFAECETALRLLQVLEEASRQASPAVVMLVAVRSAAPGTGSAGELCAQVAIGNHPAPGSLPILI